MARIRTRCNPIGLGRSGERVVNTPCSGLAGSPLGWTVSTSRRARSSHFSTITSSPTCKSRSPSLNRASKTSQASGEPSLPCRPPDRRAETRPNRSAAARGADRSTNPPYGLGSSMILAPARLDHAVAPPWEAYASRAPRDPAHGPAPVGARPQLEAKDRPPQVLGEIHAKREVPERVGHETWATRRVVQRHGLGPVRVVTYDGVPLPEQPSGMHNLRRPWIRLELVAPVWACDPERRIHLSQPPEGLEASRIAAPPVRPVRPDGDQDTPVDQCRRLVRAPNDPEAARLEHLLRLRGEVPTVFPGVVVGAREQGALGRKQVGQEIDGRSRMCLPHEPRRRPAVDHRTLEVSDEQIHPSEERLHAVVNYELSRPEWHDVAEKPHRHACRDRLGANVLVEPCREPGMSPGWAEQRLRDPPGRLAPRIRLREPPPWGVPSPSGGRGEADLLDLHQAPPGRPGHQFHRPARASNAGPMPTRTTVASSAMLTASASPRICITRKSPSVNAANTATITAAALVMTGPVCARPSAIAARSSSPERRASATRATRKIS